MGHEHERGGEKGAFGDAEEKAHDLELAEGFGEAAGDGEETPAGQGKADDFASAPAGGEAAAGDLQRDVADEKDAGGFALELVVHEQVAHQGGYFGIEGEGDVGAIDIRNGVGDEREGDDAQPALWCHGRRKAKG